MINTYLYILESKVTGRYYIGVAEDVEARLMRHNAGYVKSTKPYCPWEVIYTKKYQTKAEALSRERKLKNLKSRKRTEEWINKQSPSTENI